MKKIKAYLTTDYDGGCALFFDKPKSYHMSEGRVFFHGGSGKAYIGKELLADVKPKPNEMREIEIVINDKND